MYINSEVGQIHEGFKPKLNLTDCNVCGRNHDTEACPFLSKLQPVEDSKTPSRARLTLPANLEVEDRPDGTTAVIARATFARGTRFGPFLAAHVPIMPISAPFPLKVFGKEEEDSYYLGTNNEEECNWMCLVAPCKSADSQNLICYQMNQDIYFSVMKDIRPDEELKVWYAPYYAVKMGFMPFSVDLHVDEPLEPRPASPMDEDSSDPVEAESVHSVESAHTEESEHRTESVHMAKPAGMAVSVHTVEPASMAESAHTIELVPTVDWAQTAESEHVVESTLTVGSTCTAELTPTMEWTQTVNSVPTVEDKPKEENQKRDKKKNSKPPEAEPNVCGFHSLKDLLADKCVTRRVAEQLPPKKLGARFVTDKWRCRECGAVETTVIAYARHLMNHFKPVVNSTEKQFRCKLCRKKFTSEVLLVKHKVIRHKIVLQRWKLLANVDEVEGDTASSDDDSSTEGENSGPSETAPVVASSIVNGGDDGGRLPDTAQGTVLVVQSTSTLQEQNRTLLGLLMEQNPKSVQGNLQVVPVTSSSEVKWFSSVTKSSCQLMTTTPVQVKTVCSELPGPGMSSASTQLDWCATVPCTTTGQVHSVLDSGTVSQIATTQMTWCTAQSSVTSRDSLNISVNDILLTGNKPVSSPPQIDWPINNVNNISISDISLPEDMLGTSSVVPTCCMPVTSIANSTSGTVLTESQQVVVSSSVEPHMDWYPDKTTTTITTPLPRVSWLTDETQSSGDSTIEEVARSAGWGTDKTMRGEDGIISRTNDISLLETEDVCVPSPLEWCSKALEPEPPVSKSQPREGSWNGQYILPDECSNSSLAIPWSVDRAEDSLMSLILPELADEQAQTSISKPASAMAQLQHGEELVLVAGDGQAVLNSAKDSLGQNVAIDALLEQLEQSSTPEKTPPNSSKQLGGNIATNSKDDLVEPQPSVDNGAKDVPEELNQYVIIPVPTGNEAAEDQSAGNTVLSHQVFTRLAGDRDMDNVKSLLSKGYSLQFLVEQEDGSTHLVDVVPSDLELANQDNPQIVVSSVPLSQPELQDDRTTVQIVPGDTTNLETESVDLNWVNPNLPPDKTAQTPPPGLLLSEASGVLSSLINDEGRPQDSSAASISDLDFSLDVPLGVDFGKPIDCQSQTSFLGAEPQVVQSTVSARTPSCSAPEKTDDNSSINNNIGQLIEECKEQLGKLSAESVAFGFSGPTMESGRGDFSMDSICNEVQKDFSDLLMAPDDSSRALIAVKDFTDLVEVDDADKGFEALSVTPEPPAVPQQPVMLSTPTHSAQVSVDGRITPITTKLPEEVPVMLPPREPVNPKSIAEQQMEAEAADIDLEMLVEEVDEDAELKIDSGPPYNCDICSKEFLKASYLYRHLRKHTGEFTCISCLVVFARKESLLSHACFSTKHPVTCAECNKTFSHKKLLTRHMATHEGKWVCLQCDRVFPVRFKLLDHQKRQHPGNDSGSFGNCHVCGLAFLSHHTKIRHRCINRRRKCKHCHRVLLARTPDIFLRHERLCYELKVFARSRQALCPICGATFTQLELYRMHVFKHTHPHTCLKCQRSFRTQEELGEHACTDKKLNNCLKCPSSFMTVRQLERHNMSHGMPEFHCFECGCSFHEEDHLSDHICQDPSLSVMSAVGQDGTTTELKTKTRKRKKITSNGVEAFPSDLKTPKVCELCGEVYKTTNSLRAHMQVHGERRFNCDQCGKKFHRKDVLQEHLYVHQKAQLSCPLCKKLLKSKKSLDVHMLQHTGEKKYSCGVCGKGFFQKGNLQKHEKTHEKASQLQQSGKPSCPYCPHTFLSEENLKRHLREHQKGIFWKCSICNETFSKRSGLRYHLENVHSGEEFRCHICQEVFKHNCNLQRHMRLHPGYQNNPLFEEVDMEQPAEDTQQAMVTGLDCPDLESDPPPIEDSPRENSSAPQTDQMMQAVDPLEQSSQLTCSPGPELSLNVSQDKINCPKCKRTFREESALKLHIQRIHDRIYKCPVCKDVLKYRYTFRRHMKRLHPDYNLSPATGKSVKSEAAQDTEVLLTVSELQLTTEGIQQVQDTTQVNDATVPVENAFILVNGAQQPNLQDVVFYVVDTGEEPAGSLPALDECTA